MSRLDVLVREVEELGEPWGAEDAAATAPGPGRRRDLR